MTVVAVIKDIPFQSQFYQISMLGTQPHMFLDLVSFLPRGFTEYGNLDNACLIHMKGHV
ncbi:hypothetical protein SAMN02745753_01148 [Marinomonas polaris DSM 16579]|jgi:hypothetical protein|uniref:Uncharacterized protein n=1 Tax=Marinomonas polaris DSM 16579 TaxID=1122206 RepID=A0A1M4Y7S4_9GAMM|nr:hypothetical protein SAMN02745753_01148 [Marinomonas polaris DSM 16579]